MFHIIFLLVAAWAFMFRDIVYYYCGRLTEYLDTYVFDKIPPMNPYKWYEEFLHELESFRQHDDNDIKEAEQEEEQAEEEQVQQEEEQEEQEQQAEEEEEDRNIGNELGENDETYKNGQLLYRNGHFVNVPN